MAVTQGNTRQELREKVGYLLGDAFRKITGAASGSTTTLLIDDVPNKTADDFNGSFLQFTSGSNNDGLTRVVTDTAVSSGRVTMTFFPAISDATATNDTAELWSQAYDPDRIHNLLNQAVDSVTSHIYDPTEDITLHSGGRSRFDIPTTFEMVNAVEMRTSMNSLQIIEGGNVWNESVDSDITITQDDNDKIFGKVATKFSFAGSLTDGDFASQSIGSIDLSGFDYIEFPIKVNAAVAASDLVLRLSATANGADTDKIIAIPALSVGEDTWVRVAMTEAASGFAPSEDTAIISVALEYNANKKVNIAWVGKIEATRNDSYEWKAVPSNLWSIDKETRDLIFTQAGVDHLGWRLLKIKGGDNPAQFTADSDVTEIPERYMINWVVGTLQNRVVKGEDEGQARVRIGQANGNLATAAFAMRNFPMLKNARTVT